MDLLTFIARIVDSLAWPGVVVVTTLLLKKEILPLVGSLRRFKYKELEAEFDRSAQEVAREAEILVPDPPIMIGTEERSEPLRELAEIAAFSPRIAIMRAWDLLQEEVVRLLGRIQNSEIDKDLGVLDIREFLKNREILSRDQLELYDELRVLRNRARHVRDPEISPEAAAAYTRAVLKLASYLGNWGVKI